MVGAQLMMAIIIVAVVFINAQSLMILNLYLLSQTLSSSKPWFSNYVGHCQYDDISEKLLLPGGDALPKPLAAGVLYEAQFCFPGGCLSPESNKTALRMESMVAEVSLGLQTGLYLMPRVLLTFLIQLVPPFGGPKSLRPQGV